MKIYKKQNVIIMIIFLFCIFFVTTFRSISNNIPNELTEKIITQALSDCSNTQLFCDLKLTSQKMNKFVSSISEKNPYFWNYRFAHMIPPEDAFLKYNCMKYVANIAQPKYEYYKQISDPHDLEIFNKIIKKDQNQNKNEQENRELLILQKTLSIKKNVCIISNIHWGNKDNLINASKTFWNDFEEIDNINALYFNFGSYTGGQQVGLVLSGIIEAFLDHYPAELSKNIEILHIENGSEKFSLDNKKFSNLRELFLHGYNPQLPKKLAHFKKLETLKVTFISNHNANIIFHSIKTLILERPINLDLKNFPSLEFLHITNFKIPNDPDLKNPPPYLKKIILQATLYVEDYCYPNSRYYHQKDINYQVNNFIEKISKKTDIRLEIEERKKVKESGSIKLSKLYKIWLSQVSTFHLISKFYRKDNLKYHLIVNPKKYSLQLNFNSKEGNKALKILKRFQKNKIKILNLNIKDTISGDMLLEIHNCFPALQKSYISFELKQNIAEEMYVKKISKSTIKLLFEQNKLLGEIHTRYEKFGTYKTVYRNKNKKNLRYNYNNFFLIFLFLISYLKYVSKNYLPLTT